MIEKIQCILKILPVSLHGGTNSQLGFLTAQSFHTVYEAFTVYYHASGRIYGCRGFYPGQKNDRKIQCILKILPVILHGGTSSQLGFLTAQSFHTIYEAFTVYYHASGRIYGCRGFYPGKKMIEKFSVY